MASKTTLNLSFASLTKSFTRNVKPSRIEIRAREIKNPDHLGQRLTFPPFFGAGEPKLTDVEKIRAIRSPKMPSFPERNRVLIEELQKFVKVQRLSPARFASHNFAGCEEVLEDMKTYHGINTQSLSNQEVLENVEKDIHNPQRFFAIISFGGPDKQFKVTTDDIFVHQGEMEAECGDQIVLEKVLLAGGRNFTLVGMPLLKRGLVTVNATVIEKTLSHMEFWHWRHDKKAPMKPYRFPTRFPYHVIRVNSIEIDSSLL